MNTLIYCIPEINHIFLPRKYIPSFNITQNYEEAKVFNNLLVMVLDSWNSNNDNDIIRNLDLLKFRNSNNLRTKLILNYSDEMFALWYLDRYKLLLSTMKAEDVLLITPKISNVIETEFDCYPPYVNLVISACELYAADFINVDIDSTPVINRPLRINLLFGKLKSRKVRFAACYYMYKYGLLDDAIAGLLATPEHLESLKAEFPLYYSDEFFECLHKKIGPADIIELEHLTDGIAPAGHGTGYPFSHEIFKNSSVSYVSETVDVFEQYYDDSPIRYPIYLSEKIWRPIISKQPFVIQTIPGTLNYIKSLGYQTFSSIIDENYNSYIKRDWSHIENTVLAAKELLIKTHSHSEQIQEIVDFNYNHFVKRTKEERNRVESYLRDFILK